MTTYVSAAFRRLVAERARRRFSPAHRSLQRAFQSRCGWRDNSRDLRGWRSNYANSSTEPPRSHSGAPCVAPGRTISLSSELAPRVGDGEAQQSFGQWGEIPSEAAVKMPRLKL